MTTHAPNPPLLDSRISRRTLLRGLGIAAVSAAGLVARRAQPGAAGAPASLPAPAPAAPGSRPRRRTPRILVRSDRRVPVEVRIPAGSTVCWTNLASDWIGIAAIDGSFTSGRIAPGDVFTHRFARRESIVYVFENHPIRNMTGRITVR